MPRRAALGGQVSVLIDMSILTWSEWLPLDVVSHKADPMLEKPGVYRIRSVDKDSDPAPQRRFLGIDQPGCSFLKYLLWRISAGHRV